MIPRLCYVTDGARGTGGRPLARVLEAAVRGGLRMAVLRERQLPDGALGALLEALLPLRAEGLLLLVSRRLDVARAYGLDGVHLAADAIPVREARGWLGGGALIGYSAHSSEEARAVASEGADYVTLSPIYPTDSKPGSPGRGPAWLADATRGLAVPALALGGIGADRVGEVLRSGAWGVATVSALGAAPDPEEATRALLRAIDEEGR